MDKPGWMTTFNGWLNQLGYTYTGEELVVKGLFTFPEAERLIKQYEQEGSIRKL